jgi:hypothetical protein
VYLLGPLLGQSHKKWLMVDAPANRQFEGLKKSEHGSLCSVRFVIIFQAKKQTYHD